MTNRTITPALFEQLREALIHAACETTVSDFAIKYSDARVALEAQPVAQPVAYEYLYADGCWRSEYTWNGSKPIESRALYAAPVMYKNAPELNTSQERVQNLEKSNQMLVEALKGVLDTDGLSGSELSARLERGYAALAAVEKP